MGSTFILNKLQARFDLLSWTLHEGLNVTKESRQPGAWHSQFTSAIPRLLSPANQVPSVWKDSGAICRDTEETPPGRVWRWGRRT
jgi:hypothetical protein